MQFTFLDMAGKTLFIRDDAERAQWTQEEMTLDAEFPRIADKIISTGQRILFKDPSTGAPQIYEIKQAKTIEPDHYQSVVAENICISELSDDHIDEKEIIETGAATALHTVLSGTLWQVGTIEYDRMSSVHISRGSVWQAVLQIKSNWNVYIEPRITITSNGTITRYLDILSTSGKWNGVRLSVDKNMLSPSVTYDDSEVVTALYGYGGTTTPTKKGEEPVEITFADVEWLPDLEHPAKPKGQTYLEDPAATAAYGRNGRARFGFYQNTDIIDAETLLQKTWEALQVSSKPAISIEGTVEDLHRMGYADEPIKLHDIALVEVLPAGYKSQLQIIRMTTDLLDPTETTVTIGAYIPNIVYIEQSSIESITGSRGGGGNKSQQTQRSEYETAIQKNNRAIMLRAYQNDLDDLDNEVKEQEARITIEHNRITQEVIDRRDADNILNASITVQADRITQEVTERKGETATLSSQIVQEAGRITQEITDRRDADTVLHSQITQTADEIALEVTRASAAEGELSGRITVNADAIMAEVTRATGSEETLSGRLTITESAITQEVTDRTNADTALSGRITVNADAITAEVTRATGEETTLSGRLTVTESAITQEVTDRTNADDALSGRITVNADAITAEVTRATGEETTLSGRITVNSDAITAEVTRATGEETALSGRLTVTETAITQEVTDRTNADDALSGRITVNANKVSVVVEEKDGQNVVKASSIVAGINDQTGSYVKISADTINLTGYVTASELSATNAKINNLTSGATTADSLKTKLLSASTGFTYQGHSCSFHTVTIGSTTYHLLGY